MADDRARLLSHYDRERGHVFEMLQEFSARFPQRPRALDPFVERLIEGFAYLAARVQLRLDDEFPRFTQTLLQSVFPGCLAPTPAMSIAQFKPDLTHSGLPRGVAVKRGARLNAIASLPKGEVKSGAQGNADANSGTTDEPCAFSTAHDVMLWPIEVHSSGTEYIATDFGRLGVPEAELDGVKSAVRIRLGLLAGTSFAQAKLPLDKLMLHFTGPRQAQRIPTRLFELMAGNCSKIVVRPAKAGAGSLAPVPRATTVLGNGVLRRAGTRNDEALLPVDPRLFQGYRLLREYFVFPARFLFLEVGGLQEALARCDAPFADLIFLSESQDAALANNVAAETIALYATPMINLFRRQHIGIAMPEGATEFPVLLDRARRWDTEVFEIDQVVGSGKDGQTRFQPFYMARDQEFASRSPAHAGAYFSVNRVASVTSDAQTRPHPRYPGTEVYVSLVDSRQAPYSDKLRELKVDAWLTNRDLPLFMTDPVRFDGQLPAGVAAATCPGGRGSIPRRSPVRGDFAWRLINHLTANYLSLADADQGSAGRAMRELLTLFADMGDVEMAEQVGGVVGVTSRPAVMRVPESILADSDAGAWPIMYTRGLDIDVSLSSQAFPGGQAYLLGCVLDEFFTRYVPINLFARTTVRLDVEKGERVMTWPPRLGQKVGF